MWRYTSLQARFTNTHEISRKSIEIPFSIISTIRQYLNKFSSIFIHSEPPTCQTPDSALRNLRRHTFIYKYNLNIGIPPPMEEALIEAVKLGIHAEVESILSKGVNPNIVDEDSIGLLHYAARVNDSKLTEMLLKYGSVLNQK
jgi:ankyrin repeat protein